MSLRGLLLKEVAYPFCTQNSQNSMSFGHSECKKVKESQLLELLSAEKGCKNENGRVAPP